MIRRRIFAKKIQWNPLTRKCVIWCNFCSDSKQNHNYLHFPFFWVHSHDSVSSAISMYCCSHGSSAVDTGYTRMATGDPTILLMNVDIAQCFQFRIQFHVKWAQRQQQAFSHFTPQSIASNPHWKEHNFKVHICMECARTWMSFIGAMKRVVYAALFHRTKCIKAKAICHRFGTCTIHLWIPTKQWTIIVITDTHIASLHVLLCWKSFVRLVRKSRIVCLSTLTGQNMFSSMTKCDTCHIHCNVIFCTYFIRSKISGFSLLSAKNQKNRRVCCMVYGEWLLFCHNGGAAVTGSQLLDRKRNSLISKIDHSS